MEADSFSRTSLWYDSNTASEHFTHAMLFLNGDDGLKTQSTVYDINRGRSSEVSMSLLHITSLYYRLRFLHAYSFYTNSSFSG